MLRNIPKVISSKLMKTLMDMGHSDYIVIADANFPAAANAKRLIHADGIEIPELLEAILPFFPLDSFVDNPVKLMAHLPSDATPEIWKTYREIVVKHDFEHCFKDFELLERMSFYEYTQNAFAVVSTGTTQRYANIILQKGVI